MYLLPHNNPSRYSWKSGFTLVELIIGLAIMAIVFAGVSIVFTQSVTSWVTNTTRTAHVQEQQDMNMLFQVIGEQVRFANNTPNVISPQRITYTVNDPLAAAPTPITFAIFAQADPNNPANLILMRARISAPATPGEVIINIPFNDIQFQANDANSILVIARRLQNGTDQRMLISRGGFR